MHQQITKALQQGCISCEAIFSTKHAKNVNSIKILWQETSWHCRGQEYTLYIKCLMGKARERPKEWWAAHLSQRRQPVQQITCKTCRGWNTAPFTCQSVLPGISSAMEMTVTLHQPPAFCQVRISSQSGKINSSQMFRHFSHEICHIISSFLFWVFSSTNIDSPEQIQLFWLTTSSGRQCPSPAEYLMIVVICGTHSRVETLLV